MEKNMKELFEQFKKSMNKVHKANAEIGLVLAELSPEEAIISITEVLECAIEAYIEVVGDVELGFDKTSMALVQSFISLKKKYGADYVSALTKKYLEVSNPDMFKHIEEMINNLRDADNDDEEDTEEEGDDLVC